VVQYRGALNKLNGAQVILSALDSLGVTHLFGVSGANIEPLFYEMEIHPRITPILSKHEFSAGSAAIGYSRVTSNLGAVFTTSGGGAFNVIPALAEAYSKQVPLIAIIGQPVVGHEGKGFFQESSGQFGTPHLSKALESVTGLCVQISSTETIESAVHESILHAITHNTPVAILVPRDIQVAKISSKDNIFHGSVSDDGKEAVHRVSNVSVEEALNRSLYSTVVILGEQIREDEKHSLMELINKLNVPVVATPQGKGKIDNSHPLYCGVIGSMGNPSANEIVIDCHEIICIGESLPIISQFGLEESLKSKVVYAICTDHVYLNQEIIEIKGSLAEINLHVHQNNQTTLSPKPISFHTFSECNHLSEYFKLINQSLEEETNFLVDAGSCGAASVHWLQIPDNCYFDIALGMGGMGFTFGNSIGVSLGNRHKTIVFAGDGSFLMFGMEIHTAVEQKLNVTYVIINNDSHGMCETRSADKFDHSPSANCYSHVAVGSGLQLLFPTIRAVDVNTHNELSAWLESNQIIQGVSVIAINVSVLEKVPFTPLLRK